MLLPYTICFCCQDNMVLMLFRNKPPNSQHWNGLGGKLQPNETPLACVRREVMEEAGIDLTRAQHFRFSGIVTWPDGIDQTCNSMGMYAFIADFPSKLPIHIETFTTEEGQLCWKPIEWVCDSKNSAVVDNIPHFLPNMLREETSSEYYCRYRYNNYRDRQLVEVVTRPLPQYIQEFMQQSR